MEARNGQCEFQVRLREGDAASAPLGLVFNVVRRRGSTVLLHNLAGSKPQLCLLQGLDRQHFATRLHSAFILQPLIGGVRPYFCTIWQVPNHSFVCFMDLTDSISPHEGPVARPLKSSSRPAPCLSRWSPILQAGPPPYGPSALNLCELSALRARQCRASCKSGPSCLLRPCFSRVSVGGGKIPFYDLILYLRSLCTISHI